MSNAILAPSFLPTSAVFEMTYNCNHKCLFCSCPWEAPEPVYEKSTELTIEEWKQCAKKLVDMGVSSISYTGGEPLMKKGILELIEYVSTLEAKHINEDLETELKPPHQFLISNGQLMTDEVLQLAKNLDISVSFSLPGLKTYHQHTKNGEPDTILQWFAKAKKMGITTTVNIAVTKYNLPELFETISNALIAGADTLLLNRFLPGGRGLKHVEELFLDESQIKQMLSTADEVLIKANRTGSVGTELPKCLLKDKDYKNLTVGTQCSAAVEFFVIGPEGRIRTCNHSPIQMNHFSEIEKLKDHPYWKKFVFKGYHPAMCTGCDLLYQCDGGCREAAHVFSGSLDSKDPVFC